MQFVKLSSVVLLVTLLLVVTSKSDSIVGFVSSAEAGAQTGYPAEEIAQLEGLLHSAQFNLGDRDHFLRKQRIEHYISRAKHYHQHEWYYNRDEALERANNILTHHERMENSAYASL
ncbi:hypothetical protein OCL06_14840 [Alteromonas sp. ASW11-19]|uniref:YARHG domain-containing protein n=1 Tax=Alteromonas salexigens TaxID=2982530 RepID=A0ABT2VRC8_9ALTE|nr:hypothetical protein [Alteromonas salexigens]MCU7555865.1 hypothetical protein [Alteromonas salexigens]